MSHTAQLILDQVVLVKVEANIYGARKKLKKEDLVLADGSKLPPDDLASLGSKRLLDPEQLSAFNRLKKEAERHCLRVGTRFLGGYIIPNASVKDVTQELDRIAQDFTSAKADFLAGYDAAVNDWVIKHPEFANIIEQAIDTVEFVSTRLSFDYLVVAVAMPDTLGKQELNRLETKIGSLSEQMFYEISVEANHLIEQSLLGKEQVTRNALRPIKRIRDKLDGLSFLDYRVAPVVNTIDELLDRIPSKGAIEGSILHEIFATAMLLADPDKTRRHGEGLLVEQDWVYNQNLGSVIDENQGSLNQAVSQTVTINATTVSTSVPNDTSNDFTDTSNLLGKFSDLFDGIFEEEESVPSKPSAKAINPSEFVDEAELALATAEQADEDHESDADFWF